MSQPERYLPQPVISDSEADKKCREIAQRVNDSIAGEQVGASAIGALMFAAITSGRTALTTRSHFLHLCAVYFDEGAADRRRNMN